MYYFIDNFNPRMFQKYTFLQQAENFENMAS